MKRVNLDRTSLAVKKFVRSLPVDHEGLELELDGRVICKIISPLQLTEEEKQAFIEERWQLIRRARERNKGVPARVIAREVREAVETVRRKRG